MVDIRGRVLARGQDSGTVLVVGKGSTPLTNLRASAAAGKTLVVEDGEITDRIGWSG